MQKYYTAAENPEGAYVTSNHVRYSVSAIDTSKIHIPVGRENDLPLYKSKSKFLTAMGLESVEDHVFPETPVALEPVPSSITAWQAKAGLAMTPHPQAGTMLVAAEAAIAAMPDGAEKIVVQSAWANNANFDRTSPTILSFGAALEMTSDDLDNLFRLGGGLTV